MYLRELFIKNNGPLRELGVEFELSEEQRPIPYVFVGANGSGKTNLLSIIADALIRAASTFFTDVVTPYQGAGRSYFRILGGRSLTYQQLGGFSILRFTDGPDQFFHIENVGNFTPEDAAALVPESLKAGARWNAVTQDKNFNIPKEKARKIYETGVYAYFPSSRSEYPNWLNQDSLVEDRYEMAELYTTRLNKPIFVERSLDKFSQWLLGLLTDSRMEVTVGPDPDNPGQFRAASVGGYDMRPVETLDVANQILRVIMNDPQARFFWIGRHDARKVGVASGNQPLAAGLDALSGGQASLLSIFGTLLRYADIGSSGAAIDPSLVSGVVVIDELDAHMHIDLQMNALPKLIALFPSIQFIVSSHSPFFVLGMERAFTADRVKIIDLPTGLAVSAEAYNEFGSALSALMDTQAFEETIGQSLAAAQQPIVWLAGPTDVPYFKKAAELLGYPQLVEYFEWIGTPGRNAAGGEYTGDSHLKAAVKFLRANPGFTNRTVIAIYDNDANQADDQFGNVHIIALEKVVGAAVEDGIENLLPPHVFTPDVIQIVEKPSSIVGVPITVPKLRKPELADKLCGSDATDRTIFEKFRPYLNRINQIVTVEIGSGPEEPTITRPAGE